MDLEVVGVSTTARPIVGLPARANVKQEPSTTQGPSSNDAPIARSIVGLPSRAKVKQDPATTPGSSSHEAPISGPSSDVTKPKEDQTTGRPIVLSIETTRRPTVQSIAPNPDTWFPASIPSSGDLDSFYHTEPNFGPRRSNVHLHGTSRPEDWILGRHWQHRQQVIQDRLSATTWPTISPSYVRFIYYVHLSSPVQLSFLLLSS